MERFETSSAKEKEVSAKEAQEAMKACTLYALNDMLYRDGRISAEKKQAVDFEIWKQYHF